MNNIYKKEKIPRTSVPISRKALELKIKRNHIHDIKYMASCFVTRNS